MRRNRWLAGLTLLLTLLLQLLPVNASAAPVLEVFVRDGCPQCAAAKAFLPELQRAHPQLRVQLRSLNHDPKALQALLNHSQRAGIAAPGVPTFVLGDQVLVGFDDAQGMGRQLHALVQQQATNHEAIRAGPFSLSAARLGLPLFTLALGLLDGFNPCAMWVLLFLLALLVHWRDRRRMALVAGTFVLVSGAVYFAFMAAWLHVFLAVGLGNGLRITLGSVALLIGAVNLREISRQGEAFTLSITASAKPGLYARMRTVIESQGLGAALLAGAPPR